MCRHSFKMDRHTAHAARGAWRLARPHPQQGPRMAPPEPNFWHTKRDVYQKAGSSWLSGSLGPSQILQGMARFRLSWGNPDLAWTSDLWNYTGMRHGKRRPPTTPHFRSLVRGRRGLPARPRRRRGETVPGGCRRGRPGQRTLPRRGRAPGTLPCPSNAPETSPNRCRPPGTPPLPSR